MTLMDRITKAQNERHCILCGQPETKHWQQRHAFREEPVRRFAPKDITGYAR